MKKLSFKTVYMWILIIGGILGMLAASILTYDKLKLAANPNYVPNCSISPVVACSPVIGSPQASAFGFPNTFIGIGGFAMVLTVGTMLLAGGVIKKNWFWWCFQAGSVFGMFFVGWLIHAALYDIGKLCIYCMAVWTITIAIFWSSVAFNLKEKHFVIKGKLGKILAENPGKIIVLNYLLVIVLIITRFADYFHTII